MMLLLPAQRAAPRPPANPWLTPASSCPPAAPPVTRWQAHPRLPSASDLKPQHKEEAAAVPASESGAQAWRVPPAARALARPWLGLAQHRAAPRSVPC